MNPDFLKIAEAMGAKAWKASSADQLEQAVTHAIASGAPAVVDVDIDVNAPGYRCVWYLYPNDFWAAKSDIPQHI